MFFRSKVLNSFFHQSFRKNQENCTKHLMCLQHTSVILRGNQIPTQKVKIKTNKNVKSVNKFVNRSHNCGELTVNHINENVQLCGWLEFHRMGKFIILRDSYGSTQFVINENNMEQSKKLQNLSFESVLSITGTVLSRPKEQCNPKMKTGDIEVQVESIEVLNSAIPQLPFSIRNFHKAKESLQMQYRYLALRYPELQRNLRVRSWVIMKMREYLINKCGFVDVATPTLFRKTPGGAQEFIVPTQHVDKFYSLVQSPQQFKQLLMIGGIDRYFQVAQCYRDEGSRSDRQPEFTQLDIEMSFVDRDCIINMIENLITQSWPEELGTLQVPFQRLTYEDAMEKYGSDSPDLRIPERIHNLSDMVKVCDENFNKSFDIYGIVFNLKQKFLTKSAKEKLTNLSKQVFQEAKLIQLKIDDPELPQISKLFTQSARKCISDTLNLKKDDVLFLTYGPKSDTRQLLGKIRVEFTNILEAQGDIIRSSDYKFLWIIDMPLFEVNDDTETLKTAHHPFTHPHPDDFHLLNTNPLKVRGLQYDLVLNGSEIGGGSIRIHKRELQEKIFEMLNIDPASLFYLLEALDCGAPPHGGIAIGLDRYISMICGTSSIREVIAFPKTMEGRDLMAGAPTSVSDADKKLYHIQSLKDNSAERNIS